MKQRILSALVAIPLGLLVLYLDNKELFVTIFAVLSVVAVYEVLVATKYIVNKSVSSFALFFTFVIPFMLSYQFTRQNIIIITFVFIVGMFTFMLFKHDKVKFANITFVSFVVVAISVSFSSIPFIWVAKEWNLNGVHSTFLVLYTVAIPLIADAGAYFTGVSLGRHKMAPRISPKKTWEGFVGGLVSGFLAGILLGAVYQWFLVKVRPESNAYVDIPNLAFVGLVCAVLSVLGDLSASIVKRECSVKDFGNIMPGHGGVLDRFDSLLFAAPFVYIAFQIHFPIY